MNTPELSASELSILNDVIRYMEDNKMPVLIGDTNALNSLLDNAGHALSSFEQSVKCDPLDVCFDNSLNHLAQTITGGPSLPNELSQLIRKLSSDPTNSNGLTLDHLITLRNQNNK